MNTIKFKQLHPAAHLPTYATDGSAAFDLYVTGGADRHPDDDGLPIEFFEGVTFRTGLAVEVPPGRVLLIFSRSGHGFEADTRLANCVGVIDSDYRGEILVRLFNDGDEPFMVRKGDRIAQGLIVPAPQYHLEWADELSETARGAGGFGSSGK